jgi:hypothetical protein
VSAATEEQKKSNFYIREFHPKTHGYQNPGTKQIYFFIYKDSYTVYSNYFTDKVPVFQESSSRTFDFIDRPLEPWEVVKYKMLGYI